VGSVADRAAEHARRERFTAIYQANYHRLLGYALRRTSDDAAADDVAEVFLVAWRRLEHVPDGDAARLWLYGTARRVVANQERARRRRERLSERIRLEPSAGVDPPDGGPNVAATAAAFARLRLEERELLGLVAWEELDAGEVAQVYGCSRNAARIRLYRARRHFTRELARARPTEHLAPECALGVVTLAETEEPL
jgi:RNA polymerase sigma factor (sigma-70 family)